MADEEGAWFRENPEPQSSVVNDELTLWNFPVAKADLGPGHDEAIRRFASSAFLANSEGAQIYWDVRGHASKTGQEQANSTLAQRRADNVGAVLTELGFRTVDKSNAGSSEPADPGTSGQALARNRRVTVKRFMQTYQVVTEQKEPAKPTPRLIQDPTKFTVPVRVKIKLTLRPLQTPKVVIAASMIGDLTVALKGSQNDPVAAGVTTSDAVPALTEEFEQDLARNIGAKLGLSEGTGTGPPTINVGIEAEEWFLYPKLRYQEAPYFVYFDFKAIVARLPIIEFRGSQVYTEFSGNFRFELAPSSSTVATYRSVTDPGPNVTGPVPASIPVDGGALLIAETITAAGKQATPLAQTEIGRVVLNLATRDGAAARVAWEALGPDGKVGFDRMKLEWGKRVGKDAQDAWVNGSDEVDAVLQALDKDARDQRKNAWKTKYGSGQPKPDFESVRERVFQELKGYDDDRGDLKAPIEGL